MEQTQTPSFAFDHTGCGVVRFPPNVEQITVRHESNGVIWLVVRRNDVELRMPLSASNALHLAGLLAGG